ncbi:MAG: ATP-dependent Clp protease adaptor ClpS [Bacteroidota bacterium]|nr:ATP-dependent Clp protease adaptor ClpS [Bacteroidota bacterium]
MKNEGHTKERTSDKEIPELQDARNSFLILHNDDVNTFDFVIKSLIEVCGHNNIQAEQCTFLIHYRGKCDVKKGSFPNLKPMKEELISRGLKATID